MTATSTLTLSAFLLARYDALVRFLSRYGKASK